MKVIYLQLFLFVISPFVINSQILISETGPEVYKWIIIENKDENKSIFESETLPTPQTDFLLAVREMVKQNKLSLYSDSVELNKGGSFHEIPEIRYILDYEFPENNISINRLDYLTYRYQNLMPLMDEYDEPLININTNGEEEFVYALSVDLELIMQQLEYMKILKKEVAKSDFSTINTQILAVGFKPKNGGSEIWLDWKDIMKNESLSIFPCIQKIVKNDFDSFQYRQYKTGLEQIQARTKKIYGVIEKNEKNSLLFSKENELNEQPDFIDFIVEMVNDENIQPYYDIFSMVADFYTEEPPLFSAINHLTKPNFEKKGSVKMLFQKGAILVNENGDLITVYSSDSEPIYVRIEDEYLYFNKYDVTKYWIIQGKSGNDKNAFNTNAIVFFNTNEGKSEPLFLIDIDELSGFIQDSRVEKWYTYLKHLKLDNNQIFMQSRSESFFEFVLPEGN